MYIERDLFKGLAIMTVEADKNKTGRVGQQVRDSGRASVASPKSVCWPVVRSIQAFN